MSRRSLRVIVNGTPYTVETDDLTASPLVVRVNGEPFTVELPQEDAGSAEMTDTSAACSMPEVSLQGAIPIAHITAPMPGTIIAINVKAGDAVKYKQELCVLEAMKMNNAIRAPQDGVIAEICVTVGQSVAHGDLMFKYA